MKQISLALSLVTLSFGFGVLAEDKTQVTTTTIKKEVVVEQPTTVVEASPLEESKAERLRKQRQGVEVDTEQKIVEKLEESRLQDERDRAERIFGGKLQKQEEAKVEAKVEAPPVYQNQQMPVQQVVVPAAEVEKKVTPDDLNSTKKEIIDAIREQKESEAKVVIEIPPKVEAPKERYYISALIGKANYPNAKNIEGKGSGGVMIGAEMPNNFMVEAGLIYSNYFMDDYYWVTGSPIFKELDQYSVGMNVKYSPLSGKFKPFAGVGGHYTYRKYFDRFIYNWGGGALPTDNQATSNAFDLSISLGMDLGITDTLSVGFEYRHNTNLIYRTDSEIISHQYRMAGAKLVEEADYSMFLLNAKVRF